MMFHHFSNFQIFYACISVISMFSRARENSVFGLRGRLLAQLTSVISQKVEIKMQTKINKHEDS